MKKKLLPAVMALITALFLLVPAALASSSTPVLLDGNDISREIGLSLQAGESWVKLRPLAEKLGWDVTWNDQTGTIQLVRNHKQELAAVVGAGNLNPLHAVALRAAEIAMAQSSLSGDSDLLHIIKNFDLDPGTAPSDYARPGVNPWIKLGLWQTGK